DGGGGIELSWKCPGKEKERVPPGALWHDIADEKEGVPTGAAKETPLPPPADLPEPPENASIEEKAASVFPRKDEDVWLQTRWRRNLHEARLESQLTGKPLFLWIMNGNPMGCT